MRQLKKFKGYSIFLSDKPSKKYLAIDKNGKKVYFGAIRPDGTPYEQYKDRVGHYSEYDHLDEDRRERYYKRHPIDYPVGSADWFSKVLLW